MDKQGQRETVGRVGAQWNNEDLLDLGCGTTWMMRDEKTRGGVFLVMEV
jgi:hypothetical protein